MTTSRQRIASLVLAGVLAAVGAFATSATFAASDAHALQIIVMDEGGEDY